MKLNEDLFDELQAEEVPVVEIEPLTVNEIEPTVPEQGPEMGMAQVIHDLIINTHEAIEALNGAIASSEEVPEVISVFQEIANGEMENIGKLESALKTVSPNAENIEIGNEKVDVNLEDENSELSESLLTESKPKQLTLISTYFAASGDDVIRGIATSDEALEIVAAKLREFVNRGDDPFKFDAGLLQADGLNEKGEIIEGDWDVWWNPEEEDAPVNIAGNWEYAVDTLIDIFEQATDLMYGDQFDESLEEDTKKVNGKWVNKGKEGTHGKFATKKEADSQRKAMFANGYKG